MKNLPAGFAEAFRSNKYYFVTEVGCIIPLLGIVGVRSIEPKRIDEGSYTQEVGKKLAHNSGHPFNQALLLSWLPGAN